MLCLAALACAGQAEITQRRVNTFDLVFRDGRGELEWVSPVAFRFARTWGDPVRTRAAITSQALPIKVEATTTGQQFASRYLTVEISPDGTRLRMSAAGAALTEWTIAASNVESPLAAGERLYGLDAEIRDTADLRGRTIATRSPFLWSSAGYGEYFPRAGEYKFELGASGTHARRATLPDRNVEVFFYFGPTAKEIYEQHLAVTGAIDPFESADFAVRPARSKGQGDWGAFRAAIRSILSGSLSARLVPEFDVGLYSGAASELRSRALEFATLMPVVYAPDGMREFEMPRNRLKPFLLSYTKEARDRGYPVVRPLVIDYPDDPAADRTDEFLLGDEILVAPADKPGSDRMVYLPRGIWTDLATGERFKGRQEIRVRLRANSPPMFAKNSTIIPLAKDDPKAPLELHYFPTQGAEFFLFEEGTDDISQMHGGEAVDVWRFEIESRKAREYEWVIHRSDGRRETRRIRVAAKAGSDEIVSVPPGDIGH